MELKIIKEKDNPLFDRKEIEAEIRTEITPNYKSVIESVSKKFSVKPEVVRVKSIKGKFGRKTFDIGINIYKTKEELNKIEHKSKKDLAREAEPAKTEEAK